MPRKASGNNKINHKSTGDNPVACAWCRNSLNNFPNPLWQVDQEGRGTFVNKAWKDFVGDKKEKVDYRGRWMELIHPEDQKRIVEIFQEAFEKKVSIEAKYRLRYQDGTFHWILVIRF